MTTEEMGKRIAERRSDLGLSQAQLAERLGYSDKTAISKIENGISHLNQKKIVLFADALQTTPAYLMGWVDNPNLSREQVHAMEQARRLEAYSNYLTYSVHKNEHEGTPLPEDLIVAYKYKNAPQNIKDAIKSLLEIKEE